MTIRSRLRREDGAAAVEFALIVGVLVMLIFGMLQFGLAFFELQTLRSATREGARIAAVGASEDDVRARVNEFVPGTPLPASAIVITPSGGCPDPQDQGPDDEVSVTINLAGAPAGVQQIFNLDIPLLPQIQMTPTIKGTFRCEGAVQQT
jgi:Flp pilus assembly protein TadG